MRKEQIQAGKTYHSNGGLQRKVISISDDPIDSFPVPLVKYINMIEEGKRLEQHDSLSYFAEWAQGEVPPDKQGDAYYQAPVFPPIWKTVFKN